MDENETRLNTLGLTHEFSDRDKNFKLGSRYQLKTQKKC